jgi:hypothetical protein
MQRERERERLCKLARKFVVLSNIDFWQLKRDEQLEGEVVISARVDG